MAAEKKNKYWTFRNKHGRDFKYIPEELWNEFVMYMEWLESSPLYETKAWQHNGKVITKKLPKMRAATITGFQLFSDISDTTWENYCKNQDFIAVTMRIKNIIYSQKFEGASADLLNANIIARDLGLKDKTDITTNDEPINKMIVEFKNFSKPKKKKNG